VTDSTNINFIISGRKQTLDDHIANAIDYGYLRHARLYDYE